MSDSAHAPEGFAPQFEDDRSARKPPRRRLLLVIAGVTVIVLVACVGLLLRARARVNRVPLGAAPRPVSFVEARAEAFRPSRSYIGTLESWIEASVGPQYISAYVDTVLVRPGAQVRRNEVLATLNCANPAAASNAVEMEARAIEARQRAVSHEAVRTEGLLDGGFVSPNEVEQKVATSDAERAQLEAQKSKLRAASLGVIDCVLRAPFDGEIATRSLDPGAFVHPGEAIVSIVDRRTVRFTADVPERDFANVPAGAPVKLVFLATGERRDATVARRAPKADPATRTVHVEVDLDDPSRSIPVGTTGVLTVDVGQPAPATALPLVAAKVHEDKAQLFVIDGDVAHARDVAVLGEHEGTLFVDPTVAPGTRVVTEGRALLGDGDRVRASPERPPPPAASAPAARGGGFGRPL